jgi:hypothetical protein
MHVQVAVAVHVRKIQAGPAEFFELGGDFIEKLISCAARKKILEAGHGRVGLESPVWGGDMRDLPGGQNRVSGDQGYVKPNGEERIFLCQVNRMLAGRA